MDSKQLIAVLVLMGLAAGSAGAWEVKPVVDLSLMGGQNFFNGADSSFGGVGSLTLSPYTQFNDRWSVAPLYVGNYQGTKQVTDLVGGGTLFEDSQDHTVSAKVIRTFQNGLKLKAGGGYGMEFLRETTDESWGTGLYDNDRAFAGAESEWFWSKDDYVRLAYDYYHLRFPNYESLESGEVNSGLGRELSQPNVLNNDNNAVTLGSHFNLPGSGFGDVSLNYTDRSYAEQNIVVESGDLSGELRRDEIQTVNLQGTWPIWNGHEKRLISSVGYTWTHLYSNQNHYDVNQLFYNGNFYAYVTQTVTNQWTMLFGDEANPWTLNLNGSVSRQQYANRLVQDATGAYGTDVTRVDSTYVGLGFTYPIAKGFRLAANVYAGWDDSNNQDNSTYQYHYNTQTYLMGFTYAY